MEQAAAPAIFLTDDAARVFSPPMPSYWYGESVAGNLDINAGIDNDLGYNGTITISSSAAESELIVDLDKDKGVVIGVYGEHFRVSREDLIKALAKSLPKFEQHLLAAMLAL